MVRLLSEDLDESVANHDAGRLDRGLDRDLAPFGSPDYSREELIAEMASAFLCAAASISQPAIEQSAVYSEGWRRRLTSDRKLVV